MGLLLLRRGKEPSLRGMDAALRSPPPSGGVGHDPVVHLLVGQVDDGGHVQLAAEAGGGHAVHGVGVHVVDRRSAVALPVSVRQCLSEDLLSLFASVIKAFDATHQSIAFCDP